MDFNVYYRIPFVSFRQGTSYVVNIYKNGTPPSGYPLTLKGAAEPFHTQEDDDEDMFTPIRTQTGYIRIVNNGKAVNANNSEVSFDWRDILPANDMDTPVRLMAGNTITWQGFMQSETFGNTLYGDPQEMEFPVQCCLSMLQAKQISTESQIVGSLHNFAFLLKYALSEMPMQDFSQLVIQGGSDAQQWLLKKFDWQNFINSNDEETDVPKYDVYSVLEDMCRFWGWTARTQGTTIYLMCADDAAEQRFLTLNTTQLNRMANGNAAGSTTGTFNTKTFTGAIFAGNDNEDYQLRGPNKATVTADCNRQDTVMKFAPKVVRDVLDYNTTYEWQGDDNSNVVGYFQSNPAKGSFQTAVMKGSSNNGGFCRRQIYSSEEADKATKIDCMLIGASSTQLPSNPPVSIESTRARSYGGGSLSVKGSVWRGAHAYDDGDSDWRFLLLHIGIGSERSSAEWFSMSVNSSGVVTTGWNTTTGTPPLVRVQVKSGNIGRFGAYWMQGVMPQIFLMETIPVESGLHGCIFIDVMGIENGPSSYDDSGFQVGNLEIGFTREETFVPTTTDTKRPRTMEEERQDSVEYNSVHNGKTVNEWNADCIFASDNNMEYGYGLLMNSDGTFMGKLSYNGNTTTEWAEQHLADRVTSFWQNARRQTYIEATAAAASDVTPRHKVSFDGTFGDTFGDSEFYPISISRDWREDIVQLTLLEI